MYLAAGARKGIKVMSYNFVKNLSFLKSKEVLKLEYCRNRNQPMLLIPLENL
jgi:hypothetical protein